MIALWQLFNVMSHAPASACLADDGTKSVYSCLQVHERNITTGLAKFAVTSCLNYEQEDLPVLSCPG